MNRLPKYITQPGANADRSVGEVGSLHLVTSNVSLLSSNTAPSVILGYIWMDYSILFMNPSQATSQNPTPPTPNPTPPPPPTPQGNAIYLPTYDPGQSPGTGPGMTFGNRYFPGTDQTDDNENGTPMLGTATQISQDGLPQNIIPRTDNPSILWKNTGLKNHTKYAVGTLIGGNFRPAKLFLIGRNMTNPEVTQKFDQMEICGILTNTDPNDEDNWFQYVEFLKGPTLNTLTSEEADFIYGDGEHQFETIFYDGLNPQAPTAVMEQTQTISLGYTRRQHQARRRTGMLPPV